MHQESNPREAAAAYSTAHAAMSAKPLDEQDPPQAERSDRQRAAEGESMVHGTRVITPAVERVLAWHRRHGI